MGAQGHGGAGSWGRRVMGAQGPGSAGSRGRRVMGAQGHGGAGSWGRGVMGARGHGGAGDAARFGSAARGAPITGGRWGEARSLQAPCPSFLNPDCARLAAPCPRTAGAHIRQASVPSGHRAILHVILHVTPARCIPPALSCSSITCMHAPQQQGPCGRRFGVSESLVMGCSLPATPRHLFLSIGSMRMMSNKAVQKDRSGSTCNSRQQLRGQRGQRRAGRSGTV
jgi:hypothetical protein